MDKEVARKFLPMVNDPDFFADLKLYAAYRIEIVRKELEVCELGQVQDLQGRIKELKKIVSLRDEIIQKAT